ncbi:MAG TPA: hypothetical protein VHG33_07485 [Woeseiaceae bacterium]|nr:hypothetical protein [Woeseiaceae bacterium]
MRNNQPKRLAGAAFACLIIASLAPLSQAADETRAKFRAISTARTMLMAPMRDGVRLATEYPTQIRLPVIPSTGEED